MASLRTTPESSTPLQRSTLVIAGRRKGLELDEIRSLVGGSISKLSSAEISNWITRLSGRGLPNPPGQKPSSYQGKRSSPGVTRMITRDQIEQITRLMLEHFDYDRDRAAKWIEKSFKVRTPVQLATAKRAGEVIRTLKAMHTRRRENQHT